jgi:peptide/nickel transport system substrate-binding protein
MAIGRIKRVRHGIYGGMFRLIRPLARAGALALPFAAALVCAHPAARAEGPAPSHAIAIYGKPALPADFQHLPYANPNAPKGGRITFGYLGSFDALNLLAVGRNAPPVMIPYVLQPLMFRSQDEPFTLYPLLAESITTPPDRSFVEFRLNPKAVFSDGRPVTSADVIFTWDLLKRKSHPFRRGYYGKVKQAEAPDERTVRFTFGPGADWELPLILGIMPVLAKHATDEATFDTLGFTPLVGSGPYVVGDVSPGSRVILKRNPNFWGADIPTLRGLYNFDEVRFEYFRDANTFMEAFRTGVYDLRIELDPTRWATAYTGPAFSDGRIVKEGFYFESPRPLNAFIFNSRRPKFSDIRTRKAIANLFDFEWLNRNLFRDQYKRTASFFDESPFAARGRPAGEIERRILAPFAAEIPADVLEGRWTPPATDGSGRDRAVMGEAVKLLAEAGFKVRDGVMTEVATGAPLTFDIMVNNRDKERVALAFADSLKLVGISPRIMLVDSSQYWARLRTFNFDMIIETYGSSASPGNEQENRWTSAAAGREGSLNYPGVRSPAVDASIKALLAARDQEEYVASVRALDRALVSGSWLIPLYHSPERWVARWTRIARPDVLPKFDFTPDVFWQAKP